MALNLTTKKEGSALAVALEGELNTTTAPELKDLLDKTILGWLSSRRVVGREARKYVDTDIQFSCFSRINRQNHRYHYAEHMFVCQ